VPAAAKRQSGKEISRRVCVSEFRCGRDDGPAGKADEDNSGNHKNFCKILRFTRHPVRPNPAKLQVEPVGAANSAEKLSG